MSICKYTRARGIRFFCSNDLSGNHREINIAEFILVSIKVIIALPRSFTDNDIMDNMVTSLTAGGVENCLFWL